MGDFLHAPPWMVASTSVETFHLSRQFHLRVLRELGFPGFGILGVLKG